jgi:hypothetical protein
MIATTHKGVENIANWEKVHQCSFSLVGSLGSSLQLERKSGMKGNDKYFCN